MNYKRDFGLSNYEPKTPIKKNNSISLDKHNFFSFSYFNGDSIQIRDFNNYYANKNDSIKSINDFFETLKVISNMKADEIYSNNKKKELHYNEFTDDKIIDRIEFVLSNGYGMSKYKIDDFERRYFEFSFSNGKRVIGTKIYNNIFEILFIDCNHLICIDSSRRIKDKLLYECPGLFGKIKNNNYHELDNFELLKMLFSDAKNGKYDSINQFVRDCEEILNIDSELKEYV